MILIHDTYHTTSYMIHHTYHIPLYPHTLYTPYKPILLSVPTSCQCGAAPSLCSHIAIAIHLVYIDASVDILSSIDGATLSPVALHSALLDNKKKIKKI